MSNRVVMIFRIIFSIPMLAVINIIFAILGVISSFSVDESGFKINCDIDQFHNVLGGGYSSLQIILFDTAIALRAAELGVPDFLASPLIPSFFALAWLFKVVASEDTSTQIINMVLWILTTSAIFIGFFSKTGVLLDSEKAKLNIWNKHTFVNEVKFDAKEIKDSLLENSEKNACNVALELYTLSKEGYCTDKAMHNCYLNMMQSKELSEKIPKRTRSWIFEEDS